MRERASEREREREKERETERKRERETHGHPCLSWYMHSYYTCKRVYIDVYICIHIR